MRKRLYTAAGILMLIGNCLAGLPIKMDQIAPTPAQLGAGWTSNHIVVLVDRLAPTNQISNEGEGWLKAAHGLIEQRGSEACMVLRYTYESSSLIVSVNRFKDPQSIGDDWGRDKETKTKLDVLPKVGDEVRFYQRHGMHNNIAFRRGNYLIDVEGMGASIEKLKTLAEALDRNLVKAQLAPGQVTKPTNPQAQAQD